jgi:GT2 family glycosyltransferase
MVDVSVIIVSWNTKKLLLECLQSVMRATDRFQRETIVVDNASTDGSPEAVEIHFPSAKVIHNETNLGFAKANNIGIKHSKGRYVCLINSDIILHTDCVGLMHAYMEQNPGVGVLGPKVHNTDGTLQYTCSGFPTIWNSLSRALALDALFPKSKLFGGQLMTFWSHDTVRAVDVLSGMFLMVRRESLNEVGLLDENFFMYAEDRDWCMRFRKKGWKVVYFPEASAVHHGGASAARAPIKFFLELQRANLRYWKKHHTPFQQMSFHVITFLHQVVRIIMNSVLYAFIPKGRQESKFKIKRSIACIQWLMHTLSLNPGNEQRQAGRLASQG